MQGVLSENQSATGNPVRLPLPAVDMHPEFAQKAPHRFDAILMGISEDQNIAGQLRAWRHRPEKRRIGSESERSGPCACRGIARHGRRVVG